MMMDDSQKPQVPDDDAFAGMFDDDVDDGFGDENSASLDADSTDGHAIGSANASATDISDDSGNATYRTPASFLEDVTSGFLHARTDAQGKFAPKLIANTHGNTYTYTHWAKTGRTWYGKDSEQCYVP